MNNRNSFIKNLKLLPFGFLCIQPIISISQVYNNSCVAVSSHPIISQTNNSNSPQEAVSATASSTGGNSTSTAVYGSVHSSSVSVDCPAGHSTTSSALYRGGYKVEGYENELKFKNYYSISGDLRASTSGPMPECAGALAIASFNYQIYNDGTLEQGSLSLTVQGGIPILSIANGNLLNGSQVKATIVPKITGTLDINLVSEDFEELLDSINLLSQNTIDSLGLNNFVDLNSNLINEISLEIYQDRESEIEIWQALIIKSIELFGLTRLNIATGTTVDISFDTGFIINSHGDISFESNGSSQLHFSQISLATAANGTGVPICNNIAISDLGSTIMWDYTVLENESYSDDLPLDDLRISINDSIFREIIYLDIPLIDTFFSLDDEVNFLIIDNSKNSDGIIVEKSLGDSLNFETFDTLSSSELYFVDLVNTSDTIFYKLYSYKDYVKSPYSITKIAPMNLTSVKKSQIVQSNFSIWPNPSNGLVFIESNGQSIENSTIIIYNSKGQLLKELKGNKTLDLSVFPDNLYYVSIIDNGQTFSFKILKKK